MLIRSMSVEMHLGVILVLLSSCGPSSADRCGMTDFLDQLIQSVNSIQRNEQACGSDTQPRVGKAGPIGPRGPRGLPAVVDLTAIERLIHKKINESKRLGNVMHSISDIQNTIASGGLCYMGMKSRFIPDSAITASSYWGERDHEPYRARLDNQAVSGSSIGAWAAKKNVVGEWLQVDFGNVKEIAGVITQGRPIPSYHQWVRTYKVSCGLDQHSLAFVEENGQQRVFSGNNDMDTKVYNRFPTVMSCRFIRIYPQTWNVHILMRAEFVLGACFDNPYLF